MHTIIGDPISVIVLIFVSNAVAVVIVIRDVRFAVIIVILIDSIAHPITIRVYFS